MQTLLGIGSYLTNALTGQPNGGTPPAEHTNYAPASSPPATILPLTSSPTRPTNTPSSPSSRVDVLPVSRPDLCPPSGSRRNRQYNRPYEQGPSADELRLTRTWSHAQVLQPSDVLRLPVYTFDNWDDCKMGRFQRPGDRPSLMGLNTLDGNTGLPGITHSPNVYKSRRKEVFSPGQESFARAMIGSSPKHKRSLLHEDAQDTDSLSTKRRKTGPHSPTPQSYTNIVNVDGDDDDDDDFPIEIGSRPANLQHAAPNPHSHPSSISSHTQSNQGRGAPRLLARRNGASQIPPSGFSKLNDSITSGLKGRPVPLVSSAKRRSAPPSSDDEVTIVDTERHSKHFRTNSNKSSRINDSVYPRERRHSSAASQTNRKSAPPSPDAEVRIIDSEGRPSRIGNSVDPRERRRSSAVSQLSRTAPSNLRDQFKRRADSLSEDELASGIPSTTISRGRTSRSTLVLKDSATAKPKHIISHALGGWPMAFVQTYDFKEHGPDLSLKPDPTLKNTFEVLKPGTQGRPVRVLAIDLGRIRSAYVDDTTRIRVKGSIVDGKVYWFDLMFQNLAQCKLFRETHLKPQIDPKFVFTKTEAEMDELFAHPLKANSKAQTPIVVEDPELQLMEKNAQTRSERPVRHPARNLLIQGMKDNSEKPSGSRLRVAKTEASSRLSHPARESPAIGVRSTRSTRQTRSEIDDSVEEIEASEKRVFKYSVEKGLGAPWKKALTYNSGRHRTMVNFEDLERLDEEEFLNDSLIDFYMTYSFDRAGTSAEKVYFFNTHFYTTLTRAVPGQKGGINYAGVARWTSKIDLFSYDYIVVPINENAHWYLAIICNASNISRKAVNELGESSPVPETSPEVSEQKAVDITKETPMQLSTRETPIDQSKNSEKEEVMLFDDEKKTALIDNRHRARETPSSAIDKNSSRESPIAEIAQLAQLTLNDSGPKGILANTSSPTSASPNKTRRKPGPVLKKYDTDQPIIIILDSFAGQHPKAVKALKDYITEEGKAKRNMDTGTLPSFSPKENHLPGQSNFTDCGVYLLAYTEKFFKGPKEFVNRLLSREMDSKTDWPDLSASAMRHSMREIIMKLHEEQHGVEKKHKKEKKRSQEGGSPKATVQKEQEHKAQPAVPKRDNPVAHNPVVENRSVEVVENPKPMDKASSTVDPQADHGLKEEGQQMEEQASIKSIEVGPTTRRGEVLGVQTPTPRRRESPKVVIPSPVKPLPARSSTTKPLPRKLSPAKLIHVGHSHTSRQANIHPISHSPVREQRPKGTIQLPQASEVVEREASFEIFEDSRHGSVIPESPEVVEESTVGPERSDQSADWPV